MTNSLTFEEVLFIHTTIIKQTSPDEPIGVKDRGLLESAIARSLSTFSGKDLYPTVFLKAAALMESLAQNHSFHNANKRTAFSCTVTFLKLNGYNLKMKHDYADQYTLDVTTKKISMEKSTEILETHSAPRS